MKKKNKEKRNIDSDVAIRYATHWATRGDEPQH